MKIKYFEDTDTALLEFTSKTVSETREVSEHVLLDLDEAGNVVNMTIEHAREHASLPEVAFQQLPTPASAPAPPPQG